MKQLISGFTKLTATTVLVASLVACGGAEDRKEKYLEKGKTYLNDKNYEKARIEFKNVLQIDPKYAEAYYLMGQLEEKRNELAKSLGNYKKAIELDPVHIKAKIQLSKIYVVIGTKSYIEKAKSLLAEIKDKTVGRSEIELILATIEYKTGSKPKAVLALKKVIASNPDLVEGVSLLSTIYISEGKESEATSLLVDSVSTNPTNVPLRIMLAKLLAKNNDLIGAEKYLIQATIIDPDKYPLQVSLASFYATTDQVDKAENILRNAIKKDEDDSQRYLVLIEMLASKVSVKAADEELKKAIKNKPELYDLKFSQIKFYQKIGKREESKEVLKKIISEKSYDVEGVNARTKLAEILFKEGDKNGAKHYVDEVMAEYPSNNDALLILSEIALADMDYAAAINALRTVVKNDPKNSEASTLLARAHEFNGDSSLAENVLKKSIEANPTSDKPHASYALYIAGKGRIDEAVDNVNKALLYFKDSYDLMEVKLRILASQNKDSDIVALLSMMEQAKPNKAEVNLTKGKYHLSKNDVVSALSEFEKAYKKSQEKYEPLELIVKSYLLQKQPEKAKQRLQKIIDVNSEDAAANYLMGKIYLSQKNFEDSRPRFITASKSAETWFLPYASLASTYMAEQKFDKALEVYKDALTKLKNKEPAQLKMAAIYELGNNFEQAMSVYEEVLVSNPLGKLAANNLASLILDHGDASNVNRALELTKGFEKIKQPALHDTLAWAYAKSGDFIKAVEILKPIVEKAPTIAVFRYHLGYALYKMGEKSAAKSHLDVAVQSKLDFPGKVDAAVMLKSIE